MRHILRFLKFVQCHSWTLWLAALLSTSPAAVLYVGVAGREMNSSFSQEGLERLLACVRLLEKPGRLLMPGWRYPAFWHSHLQSDYFWPEVLQYFAVNFIGWWLALIALAIGLRAYRTQYAKSNLSH